MSEFPEILFVGRDGDMRDPYFIAVPEVDDVPVEQNGRKIATYRRESIGTLEIQRSIMLIPEVA